MENETPRSGLIVKGTNARIRNVIGLGQDVGICIESDGADVKNAVGVAWGAERTEVIPEALAPRRFWKRVWTKAKESAPGMLTTAAIAAVRAWHHN